MKATGQLIIDTWMLDGILQFISMFSVIAGLQADTIQAQILSLMGNSSMDAPGCQRLEALISDSQFVDYVVMYKSLPHEANLFRLLDDISISIRESTYHHI